jgi:opacity protein-like surface antigen
MHRAIMFFALAAFSASGYAQTRGDRAGTWEFGANLLDTSSEFFAGPQGTSLTVDGEIGIGLNAGYNFTNRLAMQFDFNYGSPSYTADYLVEDTGQIETLRTKMDVSNFHVKGTFYLLEGPITPYVEAGFGWTYLDSNVADGPPTTGCWWDWWWGGYVCRDFYSSYSSTRTSYTAAVGLRWDYSPELTFKADYGILEVESAGRSTNAEFDTIRISVAWRY